MGAGKQVVSNKENKRGKSIQTRGRKKENKESEEEERKRKIVKEVKPHYVTFSHSVPTLLLLPSLSSSTSPNFDK